MHLLFAQTTTYVGKEEMLSIPYIEMLNLMLRNQLRTL